MNTEDRRSESPRRGQYSLPFALGPAQQSCGHGGRLRTHRIEQAKPILELRQERGEDAKLEPPGNGMEKRSELVIDLRREHG
ncbi:MAG: hypothetical protein ABI704_11965 [Kofleriaceae bacterium]